ncbi:arabinogalactan endo-1,4-beta-galactosidase [Saonia flava]|uniref:Arabinogalactan endo-beta-1,4-galactanase n=1 Tax=Saonia flava TaxID=523696 RepID=A0A846R200_9FLAO|nr:glycosyl hydrolase 53 family protein [Saonia flava]NJB71955.1 arabinogalactan endo-1,4-beta-galactosidase [Saonia flava]
MKIKLLLMVFSLVASCSSSNGDDIPTGERETGNPKEEPKEEEVQEEISEFYLGADLSYVNEMEDCGAVYYDATNNAKNPYTIFKDAGANIVRIRLWHNPTWTSYSAIVDVKESIQRAKAEGMKVLLDFHYSDTWADPGKQEIPAAWLDQIDNTEALGNLLYEYTYDTLTDLITENLAPDIVQVGNEINAMILQEGELEWPIDWTRNAAILNKGIKAVRDASSIIEIMLHIAQPENATWWFEQATAAGVTDYDWIGLSYYPVWSEVELDDVSNEISILKSTYDKRLMVVETAYIFTTENADAANNVLGNDSLVQGFEATQEGQLGYLNKLKEEIEVGGGEGLIYWEPAWVSTSCNTLWAQGSHWDNATLFDHDNKVTMGMDFYDASNN